MHTVKVVFSGLGLLGACSLIARRTSPDQAAQTMLKLFVPLWLIGSGLNLYVGVKRAGYPLREEVKPFLVVFLIPIVIAFSLVRFVSSE